MGQRIALGTVDDIPEGGSAVVEVNKKDVAVFRSNGAFFAVDDLCPHMGASLAAGYVENGGVTCPWHAWRFCIKSGTWLDNPNAKTRTETYAVRVADKEIQVLVPDPADPPPQSVTSA